MAEHFDRVHSYCHVDFTERDLFEDALLPAAGSVRTIVTCMDHQTIVRLLVDREGLFVTVDPGVPVTELVEAVEAAIEDDPGELPGSGTL